MVLEYERQMTVAKKSIRCVILDLHDTLLNTDGIVGNVLKVLLGEYGKEWDGREVHKIIGRKPFEAAAAVVQDDELSCSTTEFLSEISPLFSLTIMEFRWPWRQTLQGKALKPKYLIMMVGQFQQPLASCDGRILSVIIGGDQVRTEKPSPEIFLEAARRINIEPSSCLVIEDTV
ncbi:Bifunctional riboflavin kinase/FMN phosphatase FMN phosphatase [Vigna angularis]|uniref:Bifunctional riboflavin kinase/FMN phosphatase FMN phosphatase n=1 Tax=Phaseolus angularis TaxID=3914 RepID=A0A8T0LFX8_PHAAN|nr:Bifunctional riboflavin kinase/FMN phosphatase FMN phosphatase [Vigna angularis]